MTACCCSAPGTPMLFQGQEFGVDAAVPLLRRPRRRAGAAVRAGTRRVPARSFRRSPEPAAQAALRRPGRARDLRALQAGLRSASAHARRRGAAPRSAARCGASDPAFAQQRARSHATARCWATRRSCCASSATTGRRRPAAARQPGTRSAPRADRPSRCWRRRAGARWRVPVVQRAIALRRPRRRRALDTDDGWLPARARPRWSWPRTRRRRVSDDRRRPVDPILAPNGSLARGDDPAGLTREWLITNGLGGYASGTLARRADAGAPTACWSRRCRRRSAAR